MRDMKSMITYIFQKKLGIKKSNMKYEKFNEDIEKGMDIPNVNELLEEELLNCELIPLSSDSSSGSSESLNKSDLEISEKGNNSCSDKNSIQENCDKGEKENVEKEVGETNTDKEVPVKLIVTYHFSFDTKENEELDTTKETHEDCDTATLIEGQKGEATEASESDIDENDEFEDGSFCSEDEQDLLEYSSVKNGSKNNLLDESYGPELCYSVKNVCLVNLKHNQCSIDSEYDSNSETSSVKSDDMIENIEDLENSENLVPKSRNQSTYLRKNYIYYSSAVKLYSGQLRYDDDFPEKKFKFARKIFKKVFPSQKYVVNN